MGPLDILNHLLNFVAPAAAVALLLALGGRWVARPSGQAPRWWMLALGLFVLGTVVLAAGLLVFGTDGKMATYAALVLVCACGHWVAVRGWRR